jgi:hypothetical protein
MDAKDTVPPARERIVGADFANAHLHDANFEGARLTDSWLRNAQIDGYIGGLKINGIEIAPLIEAELDRLYPERTELRADDPATLQKAWTVIEQIWASTVDRAMRLPEARLHEQVNDEWSFVETLRHLIMATDAWILRMVGRDPSPYHPWGLPHTSFTGGAALGLDLEADPSVEEVLAVRAQRMSQVAALIQNVSESDLSRMCTPPDTTGYPQDSRTVRECFMCILNEEWWHSRYANRDLATLESMIDGLVTS